MVAEMRKDAILDFFCVAPELCIKEAILHLHFSKIYSRYITPQQLSKASLQSTNTNSNAKLSISHLPFSSNSQRPSTACLSVAPFITMSFPYKHVLLIGATSGIGKGMADQLARSGVKVTAVGRRKERLDAFVSEHGSKVAAAAPLDIGDMGGIVEFTSNIIKKSPDIDCLFLNAGVQGHYDVSAPETIDLKKFNDEMRINYTSLVALTFAFLPFLKKKAESRPASIIL